LVPARASLLPFDLLASARQTYGTYEVVRRLGSRVVGAVRVVAFLVRPAGDSVLSTLYLVAGDDLARVRGDIERYRALAHPALDPVTDLFEVEHKLAVVFAHESGVRLDRLKGYLDRDRERIVDAAAWYLGAALFGALSEAHLARDEAGEIAPMVHGSLSLHDVVVSWDGAIRVQGLCPHLGAESSYERPDEDAGVAQAWLSPDVRAGAAPRPADDTFSAAMVMRSLLTGRPPATPGAEVAPLTELRADLPRDVARALDAVLLCEPSDSPPSSAELARRFEGIARVTQGQRALCECMELYQALWGLWSVAAPEVWSQEEPVVAPHALEVEDGPAASMRILDEVTSDVLAEVEELAELDEVVPQRSKGFRDEEPDDTLSAPDSPVVPIALPAEEDAGAFLAEPTRPSDPDTSHERTSGEPIELTRPHGLASLVEDDGDPMDDTQPDLELMPHTSRSATGLHDHREVLRRAQIELGAIRAQSSNAPAVAVLGHFEEDGEPEEEAPEVAAENDTPAAPPPSPWRARDARAAATPRAAAAAPRDDEPGAGSRWGVFLAVAMTAAAAAWYASKDTPAGRAIEVASAQASAGAPQKPPPVVAPAVTTPVLDAQVVPQPPAGSPAAAPSTAPADTGAIEAVDVSDLQHYEGYLVVDSSIDAMVMVQGVEAGPTNHRNKVRCRQRNVRLRHKEVPTDRTPWLSEGLPVDILCQQVTRVRIEPTDSPEP
jgi:hypothetical protein